MSLDRLALVTDAQSQRSSSWDRTGGNVDCLTALPPEGVAVLLDATGPGKVTHIWLTVMEAPCHSTIMRDLVIRMFWDGCATPSVEVPLGDFFGLGHALPPPFYEKRVYTVQAAPVTVGINERAMNCYWPMPFHRSARIEVYNNGAHTVRQLYFHVDYELGPQPPDSALFHAEFRQVKELAGQVTGDDYRNLSGEDNYVLFETEGRGHYAGCFLYIDTSAGGWWGEGDDMIFIDHAAMPTIIGTGSEDYFNNAWCYHRAFTFPYYGCPLLAQRADGGAFTNLYRFHVPDPIRFQTHIRVTIERWWETSHCNNMASVAFWYQQQPLSSRRALPKGAENHPIFRQLQPDDYRKPPGGDALDLVAQEVPLRALGVEMAIVMVQGQEFLGEGALVVRSEEKTIMIPLPVPQDGLYRVELKPVYGLIQGAANFRLGSQAEWTTIRQEKFRRENDGPRVNLGSVRSNDRVITLEVSGPGWVPLHVIECRRLD